MLSSKLQRSGVRSLVSMIAMAILVTASEGQLAAQQSSSPAPKSNQELQVNWLYGAYVDKDVPLHPLSNHQRLQLFLRQSFTTPGVYFKTAFFALSDQPEDHPREWGDGFEGYVQRTSSRYGQFVTQNALSAAGNALLGFEPRYDRCRCTGFWPRTRHAVLRNFVTSTGRKSICGPSLHFMRAHSGPASLRGPGNQQTQVYSPRVIRGS
jgi:hypothetical protein